MRLGCLAVSHAEEFPAENAEITDPLSVLALAILLKMVRLDSL